MLSFAFFISCSSSTLKDSSSTEDSSSVQQIIEEETPHKYVLSTQMFINRSGRLFIVNRETGEEVWSLDNNEDTVWPSAQLSSNGRIIWHNVVDIKNHEAFKSKIIARDFDGNITEDYQVSGSHHDFTILDDGSIVVIQNQFYETESYGKVAADKLVVVKDGQIQPFFTITDYIEIQPLTTMWDFGYFEDSKDFSHANALQYYPEHGCLLLTIPGVNAIWSISTEGDLLEVYLGADMDSTPYTNLSNVRVMSGGEFGMPHGATLDGDGNLWVLSNGFGGGVPSFAQGYDIKGDTMELIASITPPVENAHSPGLGSVERLEEDRILINWGIFGVVEEVDFEGNRLWSVEAPIQHSYGMSRGISTSKLP
jgi:hypothetical protein